MCPYLFFSSSFTFLGDFCVVLVDMDCIHSLDTCIMNL